MDDEKVFKITVSKLAGNIEMAKEIAITLQDSQVLRYLFRFFWQWSLE